VDVPAIRARAVTRQNFIEPKETRMTFMRVLGRDVRILMLALLFGSAVTLRAAAPTIASISPKRGVTSGGEAVTITGSGFTGTTGVFFGGAAAGSFNVVDDTRIDAITPARNAGPVDVVVTNADGSSSLVEGFLYGIVPLAVDDSYSTPLNTTLTVAASGVLGNDDNSLENGTMTTQLVKNVSNGVLDLKSDGSFTYTPNTGFSGDETFQYRAVNSAGAGNRGTVTIAIASARKPLNLYVAAVEKNLVTLRWTTNPSGLGPTDHIIEGGANPGEVLGTLNTGSGAPIFTFTAPTGAFYFRVRAVNGPQISAPSDEIRVFVNIPVVPSAPADLVALVADTSLGLAWRNTFSGGEPTNVVLDVSGSIATSIALGFTDTFSFAGVPAGTYTLSLRALNATGASTSSNAVTLTFPGPCSGVPLTPINFLAYKVGGTIFVIWDPAATGPAPTSYVVNVGGSFFGSIPTAARKLSGAPGAGSYTLSVTAVNACGASAPTASQTVSIP
jgi:large repetitive protein